MGMDQQHFPKSTYLILVLPIVSLLSLSFVFRLIAPFKSEFPAETASHISALDLRASVRLPLPSEAPVSMPEPLIEAARRSQSPIDKLPPDEQSSFQAAIHEARHSISPLNEKSRRNSLNASATHFAANPGQDLRFHFLKSGGIQLSSGRPGSSWQGTMVLKDSGAFTPWTVSGTRAERSNGTVSEWYVNKTDGMEHGFTLHDRPSTPVDQPIVLRVVLDQLRTASDPDRPGNLIFSDPTTGLPVLSYRTLKVWDADQRLLAAEMRPTSDGFLIALNDTDARYPVTVDPLIASLEHQFQTAISVGAQQFGISTVVDGNNMAVGSMNGPVNLYQHDGTNWILQQKIQPPSNRAYFGSNVALSGNQLAIVGYISYSGLLLPELYLYERTAGTWMPTASFQPEHILFANEENPLPIYGIALLGSLALDGNMLAFGSSYSQSVVVYKKGVSGWVQDILIEQSSNPLFFGHCVAVSGETLVVGAPEYQRSNTGQVYVYTKSGNLWLDPVVLTSPTPLIGENFGSSVAISADRIAVGARLRNFSSLAPKVGAAYTFQRSGGIWIPNTPLANPSPVINGQFGSSVALEGTNLIVGSQYDDTHASSSGSAHYFTASGTTWAWQQKLSSPEIRTNDLFSYSVDISGNHLVVGVPRRDLLSAPDAGVAFTYSLAGGSWNTQTRLSGELLDLGAAGDNIGLSMDIDGDWAIIGAPTDDDASIPNTGAVYFLERTNELWAYHSKIINPLYGTDGRFGIAVSISGNKAAVGADYNEWAGYISGGTVNVFTRSSTGWSETALITETYDFNNQFGRSVAIDGSRLVIGSPGFNGYRGMVKLYQEVGPNWNLQAQFTSPTPQANAYYGYSVAISGTRFIVGEPRLDYTYFIVGTVNDCGAAYIYEQSGNTWPMVKSYIGQYTSERMGCAVALDGTTAVIGAGGPPNWMGAPADNPSQVGSAYVAELSSGAWGNLISLNKTGLPVRSCYGASVAISGNAIAVGAFGDQIATGIVRTYQKNGSSWTQQQDIRAPGLEADNGFGISIALSGETLAVGAFGADTSAGMNSGTAYLYRLAPPPPTLSITRNGTNAVLNWVTTPGWTLYRSSNLSVGSWIPVTVTTDGTHTYPVTPAEPKMFFRLQKP